MCISCCLVVALLHHFIPCEIGKRLMLWVSSIQSCPVFTVTCNAFSWKLLISSHKLFQHLLLHQNLCGDFRLRQTYRQFP